MGTTAHANGTERTVVRLGAYEIIKRTKALPRPFWVTLEQKGKVLVEMTDRDGFTVQWMDAKVLDEAVRRGEVCLEVEL